VEFVARRKLEAGLMAEPDLVQVSYATRDFRIKLLELKAKQSAK
jgi:hypothetical protein